MDLPNIRSNVPHDIATRLQEGEPVYFYDSYYGLRHYFLITDRRVMGIKDLRRHISIPLQQISSVDEQEHGFLSRYAYLSVESTAGTSVFTRCNPERARNGASILQQVMQDRGL